MSNDDWINKALPKHRNLTDSVIIIIKSLLDQEGIEFLSVDGRTKDKEAVEEKIKRKKYKDPERQLTDISGIRIIVFLESAVETVSNLIRSSFSVDDANSSNKVDAMSADQVGYRSVHFVCDLGNERTKLPEHVSFGSLKFEVQVRTVLQHAWAELSHDRNYKFKGNLPREIERQLYLYAGMLELADRGFSEISNQIDIYTESIEKRSAEGDLDISINSISLFEFFNKWATDNDARISKMDPKNSIDDLVHELNAIGINKISDLNEIIPGKYAELTRTLEETNILGAVRDWMLLKDAKRLIENVNIKWGIGDIEEDSPILNALLTDRERNYIQSKIP